MTEKELATALRDCLISPNEADSNMEAANVVDGLFAIARAIDKLSSTMADVALNMEAFDALNTIAKAIEKEGNR